MDVAVIGAGVIGCAVARELARRGAAVTVFDPREPGGGATHASAGVLAPYVEAHDPGPLQDLIVRSVALYDEFVAEIERETDAGIEYVRCGSLEVAFDDRQADRLQRLSRTATSQDMRWVTAAQLSLIQPALASGFCGGLLVEEHGYVDAPALVAALHQSAHRAGAQFKTAAVDTIRVDAGSPLLSVGQEIFHFDRVVIAAGSWSAHIGGTSIAGAAVFPVKGQLLRLTGDAIDVRRILWSADCYVVPRRREILVGATMEDAGFDEETTASAVASLRRAAERLLPPLREAKLIDARAGLRPATADGLPIIGPSPLHDEIILATGHFRNGIALAPVTAVAVADLVYGRQLDSGFLPFAPGRFNL